MCNPPSRWIGSRGGESTEAATADRRLPSRPGFRIVSTNSGGVIGVVRNSRSICRCNQRHRATAASVGFHHTHPNQHLIGPEISRHGLAQWRCARSAIVAASRYASSAIFAFSAASIFRLARCVMTRSAYSTERPHFQLFRWSQFLGPFQIP